MKQMCFACLLLGLALGFAPLAEGSPFGGEANAGRAAITAPAWRSLGDGLEWAEMALPFVRGGKHTVIQLAALRLDPSRYTFTLHSVAWDGSSPRSAAAWISRLGLTAAINAGMYLPDRRTHTGYMRQGAEINNGRVVERYGAFFVSGPRLPGLPPAALLDRFADDWRTLLPLYDTVVQNFRLFGVRDKQLWPESGPAHSASVLAQDESGRILLILCLTPVSMHDLARLLISLPGCRLRSAMYLEGGSPASLAISLPSGVRTWTGRGPAELLLGGEGAPLPNILGVRPKE